MGRMKPKRSQSWYQKWKATQSRTRRARRAGIPWSTLPKTSADNGGKEAGAVPTERNSMSRPLQGQDAEATHSHRCSGCNRTIHCRREGCDGNPRAWSGCWGCSDDGPEHLRGG